VSNVAQFTISSNTLVSCSLESYFLIMLTRVDLRFTTLGIILIVVELIVNFSRVSVCRMVALLMKLLRQVRI